MTASGPAPAPAAPAHPSLPYLALVLNAAIWGVSWWPVRQLHALGLHPLWASAWFFGLCTLIVLAWRPRSLGEMARTPGLWVLALASGATNAAFNWAVNEGEVVRVVLLFYLMPLWAVFLARWLLGERITRGAAARVALALCGAVLMLRPADGSWLGWPQMGGWADALGVAGGMGFALTNVMLRRQAPNTSEGRALAMFVGGLLLPAALAAALATAGRLPWLPEPGLAWMAGASAQALLLFVVNMALQYGASRVPVHAAAVVMLTEVVFAGLSAVWIGGEVLTLPVLAGGTLILSAAVLAALRP